MQLIFELSPGWWLQLLILYLPFLTILIIRKSYKSKKEIRNSFAMGFAALLIAAIAEFSGVNMHLWTYFPSNWPIGVWIGYFGVGLSAYQFTKLIDELTS